MFDGRRMNKLTYKQALIDEWNELIADYRYQTNTEEYPGDLDWIHSRIDYIEESLQELEAAE
jgi:hypothetical protein